MTLTKRKGQLGTNVFVDRNDGFQKEKKKNEDLAIDLAQKYLRQINPENVPKPIELHEKADYVSNDELQLRAIKEKQLKTDKIIFWGRFSLEHELIEKYFRKKVAS